MSEADFSNYDVRRVMSVLPHRYPMLLVDRVEQLIPRDKLFNAVNQQHRVAVRKHRHNPADVIVAKISLAHSA